MHSLLDHALGREGRREGLYHGLPLRNETFQALLACDRVRLDLPPGQGAMSLFEGPLASAQPQRANGLDRVRGRCLRWFSLREVWIG